MLIREALASDAAAIARVHVDSWRTTYSGIVPNQFLKRLSYDQREGYWQGILTDHYTRHFVYVSEDDEGNIVGFSSGGPEREGDDIYEAELFTAYLLEQHQRQGIGRQLVQAIAERLLTEGYPSMLLWILKGNPASQFYEAMGGEYVREKPIQLGGEELIEISYGWKNLDQLVQSLR